jgi:hypothetical protein
MWLLSAIAAFAATLLLAGTPVLADTASPDTPPIQIKTAVVVPQLPGTNDGGYVDITFTNERSVAATGIVFAIIDGGLPQQFIHDNGKFSPKVTISHTYGTTLTDRNDPVIVVEATFADGSSWSDPSVAVP